MKRIPIAFFTAALLASTSLWCPASDRFVATAGTASISPTVESAQWEVTLEIETESSEDHAPLEVQREKMISELKEFVSHSFPDGSGRVRQVGSGVRTGPDGNRATATVRVAIPVSADYALLQRYAQQHNGVELHSMEERNHSRDEAEMNALSGAIGAALRKAEMIASMHQAKLGKLYSLSEETTITDRKSGEGKVDGGDAGDPFPELITVRVTAKYELVAEDE